MQFAGVARPSSGFEVVKGIWVRIGALAHYDLHVDANSTVGEALSKVMESTAKVGDEDGETRGVRLLIAEGLSQSNVS